MFPGRSGNSQAFFFLGLLGGSGGVRDVSGLFRGFPDDFVVFRGASKVFQRASGFPVVVGRRLSGTFQ